MQHRVDSEVGRLRSVLLHRPGPELARLTPRNSADLLFDAIPWVGRAQEEHDAFAAVLREHGVEVLYLRDLLVQTIAVAQARAELVAAATGEARLGPALREQVGGYLAGLAPDQLADVLIAGLARDELPGATGLVFELMDRRHFVIAPLPNLVFTRDSSTWVGDHVAVTSPSMPARRRESTLTGAIYTHHPRFAGTPSLYRAGEPFFEGGDVLVLAPGALAVGVGQRTMPAAVEIFARRAFAAGVAHTVLAVPIAQERATMHLDTVATMVDVGAVLMYPAIADSLQAWVVTPHERVRGPEPFLVAAAKAMAGIGVDVLRVIDTGLDPVTAEREQWDDGNNTLALAPRLAVGYERNVQTNARLSDAGIEVIAIAGSELGSGRGGPRCMSAPISRDALPTTVSA